MNKWIINNTLFESDEINPELAVSPWSGHRQFAYDLVTFVRPERIVELGTHYGCSFFSFMQACKDGSLDTEVVAIDCWEGDEQAGFYGDEVLNIVRRILNEKFSSQNYRLIKKYFADAVGDVADESVDILHIDGLHTYEAVTEDYSTWLPKLKPNGVVLFHDVASKLGYGTNRFWDEMAEKHPHSYQFDHSWGLGVLFPKGEAMYEVFERNNFRDKMLVYEYKAEYNLEHIQLEDHINMVRERDKAIKSNEEMIRAKDEVIAQNEEMIRSRDEAIAQNEKMIRAKDEVIAQNEKMIRAKDEVIAQNEEMIRSRDEAIAQNEKMIRAKDEVIAQNEEMIRSRDEAIAQNEKMIRAKDEVIAQNEEMIRAKDDVIARNEEMIDARDEAIRSNEIMIQERDKLIKQMEEQLKG